MAMFDLGSLKGFLQVNLLIEYPFTLLIETWNTLLSKA